MSQLIQFENANIGEWLALNLSNGLVSFSVVPEVGGRVMDLSLGNTHVFYTNPRLRGKKIADASLGKNYGGSKVWPGPQGWTSEQEWPGPPDPVLDCGEYAWEVMVRPDAARICLESAHDEYTGVTMRREIGVAGASSTVEVRHTMENTSPRPVRWSIWQVTQVDASKGLEIVIPATGFHQTFGDKPYPAARFNAEEKRVHVKYEDQVAKLAVEANQGWFASLDRSRGFVLAETFQITPGAAYPDGAPVAFWVSGHGTFTLHGDQVDMGTAPGGCDPHVETEIMSPLTELQPGEKCDFQTAWHLAAFDAAEVLSVNHCGAIGVALAAQRGSSTHFGGSYGVFREGRLELVAYDRASQILGTFDWGEVSPRRPVVLDKSIDLPVNTVRCSLILFDRNHKSLGVLDRVNLH
jgi:hypothetical protein